MSKRWIYHETEEPKIIENEEYEAYHAEGWEDTPAKFIHLKNDFDVDSDDEMKVQQVGEAIEGVVNSLNGALNLDDMDKDDLENYAQEHFGVDIDKRKSLKKLKKEVKALIAGPTIQ